MAHDPEVTTINDLHFRICAHEDLECETALRSLWIEIPDHCHLQCGYCFANTCRNHPHRVKGHLSEADYLRLLNDFASAGGRFLGIPGNGEPFHRRNRALVMAILRRATELGLSTTVFTTGDAIFYDLDESVEYAASVAAAPDFSIADELARLDVVLLIKCNSLKPDVQDGLVGQPGYTEARGRSLNWLIERYRFNEHDRLGIVTSILPENAGEMLDLYRYSKQNKLKFDCDTILPRGRGRKWREKHDKLTSEDCSAIYRALDAESHGTMSSGGSYVGVACDRVKHHLYVDIRGTVYPCIGCVGKPENLALGSIREKSLLEIWNTRKRILLRENLADIVFGPCAWCANFQRSCWSCLGRVVERFEVFEDELVLFTKGCFNHRPDWGKWVQHCDRWMRRRITEMPSGIRDRVRNSLSAYGAEAFWQVSPAPFGLASQKGFPSVGKDYQGSDLRNLSPADVWHILHGELHPHLREPQATTETQMLEEYDEYLRGLLPRVLLPSLKMVLDTYDIPFVPHSARIEECAPGLVQFCNLMFFMPQKDRYFYRTIACNSLDRRALDLHDGRAFCQEQPEAAGILARSLEHRNRQVTLLQRWAEAFHEGQPAPILPHIMNFSRELEDERVDVYELLLRRAQGEDGQRAESAQIDREVRFHEENVLNLAALMESPLVSERASRLAAFVAEVVGDDNRWRTQCGCLSDVSFAYAAPDQTSALEALYAEMASVGFYSASGAETAEESREAPRLLRQAILTTVAENLLLPREEESRRSAVPELIRQLESLDWPSFLRAIGGERRRLNRRNGYLPEALRSGVAIADRAMAERLYNPVLCQFIRLFFAEDGSLDAHWRRGLNYFIWLGVFRYQFDVRSYFVLHAPNLQQQCQAFVGRSVDKMTPSGMIISSSQRLPLDVRQRLELIFTTVMDPLEEIGNAQAVFGIGLLDGIQRLKSALSYLTHDYGNSRDLLCNVQKVEQSARIFETMLWLLKAARKYALKDEYSAHVDWTTGGYQGRESVGQTLQLAYDRCTDSRVTITVEGASLDGVSLDVRIVGVLTELARNIAKHTRKNGTGTIVIQSSADGNTVTIKAVAGPTYADPCRGVREVLAQDDEQTPNREWKGVLTIKRFCLDMVPDRTSTAPAEQWWQSLQSPDGTPMMRFESPVLLRRR